MGLAALAEVRAALEAGYPDCVPRDEALRLLAKAERSVASWKVRPEPMSY